MKTSELIDALAGSAPALKRAPLARPLIAGLAIGVAASVAPS